MTAEEKAELRWRLEERERYQASSSEERERIQERSSLEADFSSFVKAAWPVIEPGNKLAWSWHYDLIAEHLTLAAEKKTKRLIVNIPPRTLKSIFISVMFPVWVWTRTPGQSFANSSYAQGLSEEHSVKRRRLVESEWFKRLWGDKIWLQKDQNQKSKFQNNYQAQMFATSVDGTMHGIGGNFLIVDDGLKPDEVLSEASITALHTWFDNTWRQRLNNPAEDVMIIVEQRTGEMDISGHCLNGDKILTGKGEEPEWTHLCIPLEADAEAVAPKTLMQRFTFPISGRVKERPLGDVLQPDRFPPSVVAAKKVLRLIWATQYQGRPSPLEGNMIKRSEVMYYGGMNPETGEHDENLPDKFDLVLTSTDAAFKDTKTADFVCVGTIGVKGPKRFILDLVMKHLDEPATGKEIQRQRNKYGATTHLIEDKANGPAIIKKLKKTVPGILAIEPEGGKISRFFAMCGEWQANNWYVDRNAAWCEPFVDHLTKFPGIKNDDDCDMVSQACIYLQRNSFAYGFTEFLKNKAEDMKRKYERKVKQTQDLGNAVVDVPSVDQIAKVDRVDGVAKPDVDDGTERCPVETCRSTLIVRRGGGKRCNQCGHQFEMPGVGLSNGQLRK